MKSPTFADARTAAFGHWEHIHPSVGVILSTTSHRKHTPCPGCGGRDRFRVMPEYRETGRWFCNGGGLPENGDGFALIGHVLGFSPSQQLQAVSEVLGLGKMDDEQRVALRRLADEQAERMRQTIRYNEERFRLDAGLLEVIIEMEDSIKLRQRYCRISQRIWHPPPEEVGVARQLHTRLLEAYQHQQEGGQAHE